MCVQCVRVMAGVRVSGVASGAALSPPSALCSATHQRAGLACVGVIGLGDVFISTARSERQDISIESPQVSRSDL